MFEHLMEAIGASSLALDSIMFFTILTERYAVSMILAKQQVRLFKGMRSLCFPSDLSLTIVLASEIGL